MAEEPEKDSDVSETGEESWIQAEGGDRAAGERDTRSMRSESFHHDDCMCLEQ